MQQNSTTVYEVLFPELTSAIPLIAVVKYKVYEIKKNHQHISVSVWLLIVILILCDVEMIWIEMQNSSVCHSDVSETAKSLFLV